MKFAICNETYVDWTFERTCADVAEAGYDAIEIAPSTLADDPGTIDEAQAAAFGDVARRSGLDVAGLHWLLMKPDGLHLTTADATVRERTTEHLRRLATMGAAMGGHVIVLGSPKQRDYDGDYDDAFARAVEACRAVAEHAGSIGVTLAIEPLAPSITNFLTTAAEAVRLIEAVDHPACRLHLDVCAMSSEAEPIDAIIRANEAHLVHFHANDANLCGPGTGDVDYVPIVAALRDIDYDGYVSVEVFQDQRDAPTIARDSLRFLCGT